MKPLALLLALMLAAGPVAAQQCTTLTYTSAPLTTITTSSSDGVVNYYVPIYSPLIGTIILTEPLPQNATNANLAVASWSFP